MLVFFAGLPELKYMRSSIPFLLWRILFGPEDFGSKGKNIKKTV
jgi:hypothetical protein